MNPSYHPIKGSHVRGITADAANATCLYPLEPATFDHACDDANDVAEHTREVVTTQLALLQHARALQKLTLAALNDLSPEELEKRFGTDVSVSEALDLTLKALFSLSIDDVGRVIPAKHRDFPLDNGVLQLVRSSLGRETAPGEVVARDRQGETWAPFAPALRLDFFGVHGDDYAATIVGVHEAIGEAYGMLTPGATPTARRQKFVADAERLVRRALGLAPLNVSLPPAPTSLLLGVAYCVQRTTDGAAEAVVSCVACVRPC